MYTQMYLCLHYVVHVYVVSMATCVHGGGCVVMYMS